MKNLSKIAAFVLAFIGVQQTGSAHHGEMVDHVRNYLEFYVPIALVLVIGVLFVIRNFATKSRR